MTSAQCGDDADTHASLSTSCGASAEMTPAADSGELTAYVTAPAQIGPGPADGFHTVEFPDSGNGTSMDKTAQ